MIDYYYPMAGLGFIFFHFYTVYSYRKQIRKKSSSITALLNDINNRDSIITKLESEIYKLKHNKSDDLKAFIHDLTTDEGMVAITRINPENIFIHNRDKR